MIEGYRLVSIKDVSSKSKLNEFDWGIDALDWFLSRYASKNDILGIGKTFVALDVNDRICGYFTLSTAQVAYQEMPDDFKGKLPKYPIPALRIARLAVDRNQQGKGIGKWLLAQAFRKVLQVADITGLYLIIVDAKETSRSFYERYGFLKLSNADLSYFMLVDTVRKAIQSKRSSK